MKQELYIVVTCEGDLETFSNKEEANNYVTQRLDYYGYDLESVQIFKGVCLDFNVNAEINDG